MAEDPRQVLASMIEGWNSGRFVMYPNLPGWQGLPCALDVLSNLPFAVAGAWGLVWLRRLGALRLCPATRATAALFFAFIRRRR